MCCWPVGALPTDVPTGDYTVRQSMSATNIVVNIDTALLERSGALTQHVLDAPGAFAEAVADIDLRRVSAWARRRARRPCPGLDDSRR